MKNKADKIKHGWDGFKKEYTHLNLKDKINNIKIIIKDMELNSNENWVSTPRDFFDVDNQCEYLEGQLSHLYTQLDSINIRRDI